MRTKIFNFSIVTLLLSVAVYSKQSFSREDRTNQIFAQEAVLKAGDQLVDQGLYQEALQKYNEALSPRYILRESDKSGPHTRRFRLYRIMGLYQEALNELENSLIASNVQIEIDEKQELKALIEFSQTGDTTTVNDYIIRIKSKYKKMLPPFGYSSSGPSDFWISTILRLYDTIGDYDAGIVFVDECLGFFKERKKERAEDYTIYDRVKTSEQALECAGSNIYPVTNRDPEWRACEFMSEYLLIREAFEQDKKEGKRGSMKEGTPGRATKVLIQSDYFPW